VLGQAVIPRVNSGLIGLPLPLLDWDKIEHWTGALRSLPGGRPVYLEQGLTAMILSTLPDPVALPLADYALCPETREVCRPTAAFHHYAGNSKYRFIRHGVPASLFLGT